MEKGSFQDGNPMEICCKPVVSMWFPLCFPLREIAFFTQCKLAKINDNSFMLFRKSKTSVSLENWMSHLLYKISFTLGYFVPRLAEFDKLVLESVVGFHLNRAEFFLCQVWLQNNSVVFFLLKKIYKCYKIYLFSHSLSELNDRWNLDLMNSNTSTL